MLGWPAQLADIEGAVWWQVQAWGASRSTLLWGLDKFGFTN